MSLQVQQHSAREEIRRYEADIDRLMSENGAQRDPAKEAELLTLRHRLGIERIKDAGDVQFAEPSFDAVPGDGLPEFAPHQMTAEALRAAILTKGFALVRGLVDKSDTDALVKELDVAFDARERHKQGLEATDPGRYEEFTPEPPFQLGMERTWVTNSSGIWTADCPSAMFRLLEVFERTGITRLATSYLGEVPLISVNKCTLRKVEPYTIVGRDQKPASAWHQDGAFLGEVRALNVWVALSHCGDDAPGLDLVPKRLDYIVPTGTEGAEYDWSLSLAEVDKAAGETGTARPIFEAGDVMLFDEMFLHSTATEPDMPHTRFAAETWFFGPSKFPDKYTPVSV